MSVGPSAAGPDPPDAPPSEPANPFRLIFRHRVRILDFLFRNSTLFFAVGILAILGTFVLVLVEGSKEPILRYGLNFVAGSTWSPNQAIFGALPFIFGTVMTSALALVFAVPLSLGIAIFLSELAPKWIAEPLGYIVELLAAVPSVVFGLWGLAVLVPFMRDTVDPPLRSVNAAASHAIHYPIPLFAGSVIGQDVFTASVILAIMIIPTISAISREALRAVPAAQREAALSLGATSWEATRISVLNYARVGIVGAIILGLGRAVGETMAVTMTIGNSDSIPNSLFGQGQTIASLIANEFFNDTPGSLYVSAIIEAALVLLIITLVINIGARLLVWRLVKGAGGPVE
ncbi:MAG: phosphate ABC transporter permease subunit PstC [Thermoplasmata archaeon]|nr:phosphate ABC transporter permease subunit PstC [Thermoplasmata archaeon]